MSFTTIVVSTPQNHIDIPIPADIPDFGIRIAECYTTGAEDFHAQVSLDGVNFLSGSADYYWAGWHPSMGAPVHSANFQLLPDVVGNGSFPIGGALYLQPGASGKKAIISGSVEGPASTYGLYKREIVGNVETVGRVQAIRFNMGSAQITGRFTLFNDPGW